MIYRFHVLHNFWDSSVGNYNHTGRAVAVLSHDMDSAYELLLANKDVVEEYLRSQRVRNGRLLIRKSDTARCMMPWSSKAGYVMKIAHGNYFACLTKNNKFEMVSIEIYER